MTTNKITDKLFYVGKFGETIEHAEGDDNGDLIKEAELFSTGVHRGVEYTKEDIEELANNFGEDDEVPIQIDHSESAKDTVGFLEGVKADGNKLLGTLRIVDEFAKTRINQNLMKKLSASFYLKLAEDGFKPYKLREVSLVAFPQVKSARLFSENGYMSEYEEVTNKEGENMTDQNEKTVELSEQELSQMKKRLKELEHIEEKFTEHQVTSKVEKFQADNKIIPAQADSLTELLASFSEEQMELFNKFMENNKAVDFSEQGEFEEEDGEKDTQTKEQKEFEEFYEEYAKKHGTSL